jgi:hypothetical protein
MLKKEMFHKLNQYFPNKSQYRQKEETLNSEFYDPIEEERTGQSWSHCIKKN